MTTINKIILHLWIKYFLGSSFVLLLLINVASLVSSLLRSNVTAQEILMNRILEFPDIVNKVLPISCLIASLFSINILKNTNELTAIFSIGFSRKQFIITILKISFLVGLLQFVIAGYVKPFSKKQKNILIPNSEQKFRNLQKKGLIASMTSSGHMWYKSSNYYLSYHTFDKFKKEINDTEIFFFNNFIKLKKIIKVKELYLKNNKWHGENVLFINNLSNLNFPSTLIEKSTIIPIQEKPIDFKQIEADVTTLYINQLFNYINRLKLYKINSHEYEVILYSKISDSIACIIFALLSSINIFSPGRRSSSSGKNIALIFIFTLIYWLLNGYLIELAKNAKINPFLGSFILQLFFLFYLIVIYTTNKKIK